MTLLLIIILCIIVAKVCKQFAVAAYYIFFAVIGVSLVLSILRFVAKWLLIPVAVIGGILGLIILFGYTIERHDEKRKAEEEAEKPLGKLNLSSLDSETKSDKEETDTTDTPNVVPTYSTETVEGINISDGVYNKERENE